MAWCFPYFKPFLGYHVSNPGKREALENFYACCEILKLLRHFFPNLYKQCSLDAWVWGFKGTALLETINDYLKLFNETELENIIKQLVYRLIRMRSFENSRIRNKYWHIIVDGTHLYSATERHCPYCLTREHKDKETGKVNWTEYYHSVLEAKLVINNCIVISIATEFIENEAPNTPKQDCELNLKQSFKNYALNKEDIDFYPDSLRYRFAETS